MFSWLKNFKTESSASSVSSVKVKTITRKDLKESIKPEISRQYENFTRLVENIQSDQDQSYPLLIIISKYKLLVKEILEQKEDLTDEEWRKVQTKATRARNDYQSFLFSYNIVLTNNYCEIKSIPQASACDAREIFIQKKAVYLAMDDQTFKRCNNIERHLLNEWNSRLTSEAQAYFSEANDTIIVGNRGKVDKIFECKKLVSINLYLLEFPDQRSVALEQDYFKTLTDAIDCLKNYLITDLSTVKGRYNNISTPSFLWSYFSWSRKDKLNAALEYCDLMVLNVDGTASLNKTGALSQGYLSVVIDGFIEPLRIFFQNRVNIKRNATSLDKSSRNARIDLMNLNRELSLALDIVNIDREKYLAQRDKINLSMREYSAAISTYLQASDIFLEQKISFFNPSLSRLESIEDSIERSRTTVVNEESDKKNLLRSYERKMGLNFFETISKVLAEICIFHFYGSDESGSVQNNAVDRVLEQQELLYQHFCLAYTLQPQLEVLELCKDLSSYIKDCYNKKCHPMTEREVRTALLCFKYLITTGRIPEDVWDAAQMNQGQMYENEGHYLKQLVVGFQTIMTMKEVGISDVGATLMLKMK